LCRLEDPDGSTRPHSLACSHTLPTGSVCRGVRKRSSCQAWISLPCRSLDACRQGCRS
jgi:hypothetical protein